MYRYNPKNIGEFTEVEYGRNFTYRNTTSQWAKDRGFHQEIDTMDGDIRYAQVKKTVAYVLTEEGSEGQLHIEKWFIKKHVIFVKE